MPENQFICDCTAVHEDVVAQVSGQMLSDELYGYVASFFKLFGDKTRIKIVCVILPIC